MKFNLIVIRTQEPKLLKKQYELLGFEFEYHQHGKGPFHYASENGELIFEIYPLTKSMKEADGSLRLGLAVENLDLTIKNIENSSWKIFSDIKETEWGLTAIIQDLDGRKVELKNT